MNILYMRQVRSTEINLSKDTHPKHKKPGKNLHRPEAKVHMFKSMSVIKMR